MPKKRKESGRTYLLNMPAAHLRKQVEEAVGKLEADGWEVYWPDRDNEIEGLDGFEANIENKKQMAACDFVHIIWDGKSSGFLFGLGMAFAFEKPVRVIQMPEPTKWRSFQNLIYRWRNSQF